MSPLCIYSCLFFLLVGLCTHSTSYAQHDDGTIQFEGARQLLIEKTALHSPGPISEWALRKITTSAAVQKNERLMTVLLAIALGPFGVHRLYLGTHPRVPVIYTLTLGGGLGILPVIDIIVVLTTKNIDRLRNNERVFMWINNK